MTRDELIKAANQIARVGGPVGEVRAYDGLEIEGENGSIRVASAAPKFRVGDVVQWNCYIGRVSAIDELGGCCVLRQTNGPPAGAIWHLPADLRLLRRPVQIGDVLRKPAMNVAIGTDDGGYGTTTFTAKELPRLHDWRWAIHGIFIDCAAIRHADGTPIEPPAADAAKLLRFPDIADVEMAPVEPSEPPKVEKRHGFTMHAAVYDGYSDLGNHADCVDARSFVALQAQLARQADMLQPKDDEIRALKAENSDLRREIDRLKRKR